MEEINNKAYDDELNKAKEEIQEIPRTEILVPKYRKINKEQEKNEEYDK